MVERRALIGLPHVWHLRLARAAARAFDRASTIPAIAAL
jgi:hypothetical protein